MQCRHLAIIEGCIELVEHYMQNLKDRIRLWHALIRPTSIGNAFSHDPRCLPYHLHLTLLTFTLYTQALALCLWPQTRYNTYIRRFSTTIAMLHRRFER